MVTIGRPERHYWRNRYGYTYGYHNLLRNRHKLRMCGLSINRGSDL